MVSSEFPQYRPAGTCGPCRLLPARPHVTDRRYSAVDGDLTAGGILLPHARAEKSPTESRMRLPAFGDGLRSMACRIRDLLSSTARNSCFVVVSAAPSSP